MHHAQDGHPRVSPRSTSSRGRRRRLRVLLWRRRHLVAAVAIGAAAAVTTGELRPAPAPTEPAVVLTSAHTAGSVLGPSDVTIREIPPGLVPDGAASDPASAVGARLAVALPAGFPLVPGVLAGPSLAGGAPPGTVVVPVRLADAGVASLLRAGDRIDLIQAAPDGQDAPVLASGALVMAGGGPATDSGALDVDGPTSPLLLVAARREEAISLAGASTWDPLSAILVPPGP